jgi:hypothetical protein
MPSPTQEALLWLNLIALLTRPRPLTREDKKRSGLKYCRYAGYGFKWEGDQRVPDPHEAAIMTQIVEWKQAGRSWYQIASRLLRNRVRTSSGLEWSPSRVRRVYAAELRRRETCGS